MKQELRSFFHFGLRITAAGLLSLCLGLAAAWSIRLALADHYVRKETVASIERAISLTSGQSIYHAHLAFLLSDSDPSRAAQLLQHAVELNPQDARSWIELGLHYEANGNRELAERYLLQAAKMDSEYLPRWTLANYYYRQNDFSRFWYWAKQASDRVYDDPKPLFLLCGRVTEDGLLLDRLQIHNPGLVTSYLSYLLEIDRLDLISAAVKIALQAKRPADTSLLLSVCDYLLKENHPGEAVEIWNSLAESRLIQVGGLQRISSSSITNGAFLTEPISRGFDWRIYRIEGVSASRETPSGLRITFSGNEPERTEILSQYIPVKGGQEYSFTFLYRTSGIAASSGLTWRALDVAGNDVLFDQSGLSSEEETERKLSFVVPPDCGLIRLLLDYRRRPGTTRIAGYVVLRTIALHPQASVAAAALPSHVLLKNEIKKDGKK